MLRVFYGWTRTNKIRKAEAISVIFENRSQREEKVQAFIGRMQHTVYVREQTEEEKKLQMQETAELIAAFKDGKLESFDKLVIMYSPQLYTLRTIFSSAAPQPLSNPVMRDNNKLSTRR